MSDTPAAVPEFMLAAMAAAGVDPDEVAAKAAEIEAAGGIDAIVVSDHGKILDRRPVEGQDPLPIDEEPSHGYGWDP